MVEEHFHLGRAEHGANGHVLYAQVLKQHVVFGRSSEIYRPQYLVPASVVVSALLAFVVESSVPAYVLD